MNNSPCSRLHTSNSISCKFVLIPFRLGRIWPLFTLGYIAKFYYLNWQWRASSQVNTFPALRVSIGGGRNFTSLALQIWGNLGKDQEVDAWKEERTLRRSREGVRSSHPIVAEEASGGLSSWSLPPGHACPYPFPWVWTDSVASF